MASRLHHIHSSSSLFTSPISSAQRSFLYEQRLTCRPAFNVSKLEAASDTDESNMHSVTEWPSTEANRSNDNSYADDLPPDPDAHRSPEEREELVHFMTVRQAVVMQDSNMVPGAQVNMEAGLDAHTLGKTSGGVWLQLMADCCSCVSSTSSLSSTGPTSETQRSLA